MGFKYENLIQRSFVENYVLVPDEAKEELAKVYTLAEGAEVNAKILNELRDTLKDTGVSPSHTLAKVIKLMDGLDVYNRIKNL